MNRRMRPVKGAPRESIGNIGAVLKKLIARAKNMIPRLVIVIFLAAASAFLTIIGPDYVSQITQEITDGLATSIDLGAIARIGGFLIAIYLTSAVFGFFENRLASTVTLKVANRLRYDISTKINRVPMNLFHRMSSGDILSRMTNDVQMLAQTLSNSLPTIVAAVAQFVGCLIMMFVTEWRMSLVAIGATLLGFLLMGIITASSQKYFVAQQTSLGNLNGYVEEMYSGHGVIRISRGGVPVREEFDKYNNAVYEANRKAQFLSGAMQPLMNFVGNLGYVAVCIYGAFLAVNGTIGFGVIVAFILYVRLFTSPLSQMAQGMTQLQTAAASGKRIFEFLEEEELSNEDDKQNAPQNVRGEVKFDHVKFAYPDTPEKLVIKDFSASVKPGQKVAIVGPTGAGKTTIVNLLMRFFEINGGSIRIDGVPTSEMTRESLHELFAMVLQDTWMFKGTLRENLVYNKEGVPDEVLEKACKACGIWDFVESLPQGFDTELSENISISAGQKQLITIARAMIQNRPMLILDEATSSVDTRTELITQRAMDRLCEKRTSFVIAHRLSTIKNADLILVLKDGNVIEQGNHEELLAQNGFYAELYNSQFEKSK